MTAARPLEVDVVATLVAVAEGLGCIAEVNGVHRGGTTARSGLGPGSPDLIVLVPPLWVALFVEAKRDEKSPLSEAQKRWHIRARARGLHVVTAWTAQHLIDAVLRVRSHVNAYVAKRSSRKDQ